MNNKSQNPVRGTVRLDALKVMKQMDQILNHLLGESFSLSRTASALLQLTEGLYKYYGQDRHLATWTSLQDALLLSEYYLHVQTDTPHRNQIMRAMEVYIRLLILDLDEKLDYRRLTDEEIHDFHVELTQLINEIEEMSQPA